MRKVIIHPFIFILFPIFIFSCEQTTGSPADPGDPGGGGNGNGDCSDFSVTEAFPSTAQSGETYEDFIVNGINFQSGPNLAVDLMDGSDPVAGASSVVWVESSTVSCDFDFLDISYGEYELRVTNGCETVSQASIPYTVQPDALKNIQLREAVPSISITDISVRGSTGEAYVTFDDGELWIYNDDYSEGDFMTTNLMLDRVAAQDCGEATMGSTFSGGQYIYQRDTNDFWTSTFGDYLHDAIVVSNGENHYFAQAYGSYVSLMRYESCSVDHTGNQVTYMAIGPGPLNLLNSAVIGGAFIGDLPGNTSGWVYILEGSPEFSVERIDYDASPASDHNLSPDQSFFGIQGDGQTQLNDPRDIATGPENRVYILDVYSSGEPVVKIYDSDLNFLGEFGDSITISGDPLRLDVDMGDGEIHVAHSDGVSVFRADEMPF